MSTLRSLSLLALLGTVGAANAAVRYTFDFSSFGVFTNTVTVTTATFLTSAQGFGPGDVDNANIFLSDFVGIQFDPSGSDLDAVNADFDFLGFIPASFSDTFDDGAFQQYGTYTSLSGFSTLTVSQVGPAVPGPMAALPFAVLALRRRRRA